MEIIVLAIMFIGVLGFIIYQQDKASKREIMLFREFVLATKAKDLDSYVNVIPEYNELPHDEQDEILNLEDVAPEKLLRLIEEEKK
jgi:hypothetical protein